MTKKHYLETEFEELMRDPKTIAFLDQGALDGLWYWDLENPEHEWMSPNFWRTLGFDPSTKAHLASEWQHLIYPEDGEAALENAQRHFADPASPYDQIVRYKTADGGTVTVRCRGLAIFDEGVPRRMLGAHTVIDDTRQSEIERQLSSMLETSDDAIIAWSVRNGILRWNRGAQQLYGPTHAMAAGQDPNALTDAGYPDGWDEVNARLSEGRQWVGDVTRRDASGKEIITSSRLATVSYGEDDIIVLQIDRDVTQQRADQEFAELVLRAGGMGAFEMRVQENKLYLDDRNRELMGVVGAGEVDSEELAQRIDPVDLAELRTAMQTAAENRTPFESEYRLHIPGQGERWVGVRGQYYEYDKEGNPGVIRGVNWDATTTNTQRAQLRLLNRELNHRVRNLFSIVLALITMTSRNETDTREMAENLRMRILALASAHSIGMSDDESTPIPFRTLLENMLQPFAGSRDQIDLEGEDVMLPQRQVTPLCLVLHEMAVNAAKHGAWSEHATDGQMVLRWSTRKEADGDRIFALDWCETGLQGTPDLESRKGFGSRLINQSLRQLSGTLERQVEFGRLRTRIEFSVEEKPDWQAKGS